LGLTKRLEESTTSPAPHLGTARGYLYAGQARKGLKVGPSRPNPFLQGNGFVRSHVIIFPDGSQRIYPEKQGQALKTNCASTTSDGPYIAFDVRDAPRFPCTTKFRNEIALLGIWALWTNQIGRRIMLTLSPKYADGREPRAGRGALGRRRLQSYEVPSAVSVPALSQGRFMACGPEAAPALEQGDKYSPSERER